MEPQKQTKSGLKKKLASVPSLQITFFQSKTAAQYPATLRAASKNWREFRPCRSYLFKAKRPHSSQRVREVHPKIGESSVHADHRFSRQNSRTVPSVSERCIKKLARVPSMQTTFFRSKSAAQYPASQRGASKT